MLHGVESGHFNTWLVSLERSAIREERAAALLRSESEERVSEIHQKQPLATADCRDYQPEFLGVLIQCRGCVKGVWDAVWPPWGYKHRLWSQRGLRPLCSLGLYLSYEKEHCLSHSSLIHIVEKIIPALQDCVKV